MTRQEFSKAKKKLEKFVKKYCNENNILFFPNAFLICKDTLRQGTVNVSYALLNSDFDEILFYDALSKELFSFIEKMPLKIKALTIYSCI